MEKIESFILNKKNINIEEILKLTNLSENYNATELIDNCLAKNQKKIATILNENNYSVEDCVMIIRVFLLKAKRLLKLLSLYRENKNIDMVISSFKPPIFWKEKDIVKQQITNWSKKNVEDLIYEITEIELLIKKNSSSSINILSDFIISQSG
jgi:DNA polymerase-3 subunit delta